MMEVLEIVSVAAPISAAVAIGACMCYCVVAARIRALTSRVQQLEETRDMQDPRQDPRAHAYPVPAHSYIRMPVLLPQQLQQQPQQQPSSTYW